MDGAFQQDAPFGITLDLAPTGGWWISLCGRRSGITSMVTRVLKIDSINPERDKIEEAADILRDGGLVAFPTETVYGLGANFFDKRTVERVYTVKQRPREKPLTVHITDRDYIEDFAGDILS